MDFGLAKLVEPTPEHDGSATHTHVGTVLGTAAYMPPEQALGRQVDRRADLWAFGCLLFEMLTGRRAFPGDTRSGILVGVLEHDPDWTILPASTPASVRQLLHRLVGGDLEPFGRDAGPFRRDARQASFRTRAVEHLVTRQSAACCPRRHHNRDRSAQDAPRTASRVDSMVGMVHAQHNGLKGADGLDHRSVALSGVQDRRAPVQSTEQDPVVQEALHRQHVQRPIDSPASRISYRCKNCHDALQLTRRPFLRFADPVSPD
jgi:serine/threonine protein kinase